MRSQGSLEKLRCRLKSENGKEVHLCSKEEAVIYVGSKETLKKTPDSDNM